MYPVSPRVVTPSHCVDRVMSVFNGLAMVHCPRVLFPLYLSYHSSPPPSCFIRTAHFPHLLWLLYSCGFTTSNLYVRLFGIYLTIGGFGLEASVHEQLNPT